ncbi:MAG: phenylalanine--tRNA ligase subunit beta [Candidatus Dormibacteraeota bacterium]|nr:phenylalanine--tRNA ligase subunit beta [Candidatus Dormibacteraeota bacterium]
MRVSYEWLRELSGVDDLPATEAAQVLTMAGWNVESVTEIDLSALLVGRVVSQASHPGSRNPLWVHQVDLGALGTRTIIAGAPNAVAGTLVPVALPGTVVPSGRLVKDMKIAGVPGQGMLCSAAELLLSDDHEGILLLDGGTPGARLDEVIPSDAILDVEVTPNRPDCLSHLGLAREFAAAQQRSLPRDFMPLFTGGVEPKGVDLVSVRIDAPDLCRRYIGAVVTGVNVAPSPEWLQRRLRAAGVRPISNVVDVTNYVLLEYGQPLHAFDLARLAGPAILVRRAREGESLLCLDGETRPLDPRILVIADAERPVALAGIIGGAESAVTDTTTDVLLEAANFEGVNVRATSRAIRLRTEASARFEKGISPELALAGARRAAMLLAELAGGQVHTDWAESYPRPQEPQSVRFRPERIDAILGVHVPFQEMESILERLGFQVRIGEDGEWDVLPPVFRLDVRLREDVAEEVGRMYGYEKVPPTLPGRRRTSWEPAVPSEERRLDACRHELAGAGYTEAVTPSLVPGALLSALGLSDRAVPLLNPISDEQDTLRTSLLPSLLRAAALNRNRGRPAVSLFEIARAYLQRPEDAGGQPDEPLRLSVVRSGLDGAAPARSAFFDLKGALERAIGALVPVELAYEPAAPPALHPGRSARVLLAGRSVGHIGEVHPNALRIADLEGRAVAAELDLARFLAHSDTRAARPLPRFPAANRDLAVIVAEAVPAGAMQAVILESAGELLESASAFDEYRGDQVGAGAKSVAFALTFRSPERTLTDAEVDPRMAAIRLAVGARFDARFRE